MIVVAGPAQFLLVEPDGLGSNALQTPPRYRRIPRSYSIASTETTVEQFRRFMENNPWVPRRQLAGDSQPGSPQTFVTWYEAAAYCNWLSKAEELPEEEWCYLPSGQGEYTTGMRLAEDYLDRRGYRLPTETEWEYACRAGTRTAFSFGDDLAYLTHYAVYRTESERTLQPVRSKMPNNFGLFDMHGNVAEWCQDQFAPYSFDETHTTLQEPDGTDPGGRDRVTRYSRRQATLIPPNDSAVPHETVSPPINASKHAASVSLVPIPKSTDPARQPVARIRPTPCRPPQAAPCRPPHRGVDRGDPSSIHLGENPR